MSFCVNCGKKLNAFSEKYGLTGDPKEVLCELCRKKMLNLVEGMPITEDFVDRYKDMFSANGITESGLGHIQRYVKQTLATNPSAHEETEEERKLWEAKLEKAEELSKILITSGFSFDGYRITKYSGYISGDDAVEIPRSGWLFTTNNSENLTNALSKIRIQALKELKEAAYDLGCNAVIGVDFDYITLEPEHGSGLYNGVPGAGTVYEPYIICVTANGNAVVIEKQ